MNYEIITRREHDIGRGTALLASGAVMVLLTWLLPLVAPLAIAGYAIYRLYHKELSEGLLGMALAVVLWYLRHPLGWFLWLVGAAMVAFGLFFLIRGMRSSSVVE